MSETNRVHEIRMQQGLPLVVLASKADVGLLTLHTWDCHGIAPKREATRLRIAEALGCTVADLESAPGPGRRGATP